MLSPSAQALFGLAMIALGIGVLSWLAVRLKKFNPTKRDEAYYRDKFAALLGGLTEVPVGNRRCDIVTSSVAYEVDWAHKFYEGIGQCVFYAKELKKAPGLILICRSPSDENHAEIAQQAIEGIHVKVGSVAYGIQLIVYRDYDE